MDAHRRAKSLITRLDGLWYDTAIPEWPLEASRYVLLSDLHLGNGGSADDFVENTNALCRALDYYLDLDYALILLGDIEELWQFDLSEIRAQYEESVYDRLRRFPKSRFLRVFGNHDMDWAPRQDPARRGQGPPPIAHEALRLVDEKGIPQMLLLHGHQGSRDADLYPWVSRFFVRLFRAVEKTAQRLGFYNTGTALSMQVTDRFECAVYAWAKQNRVIVICGHTHRAIFASKSYYERLKKCLRELEARRKKGKGEPRCRSEMEAVRKALRSERKKKRKIRPLDPEGEALPCYFNTGSGIYSDGITAIEIEGDRIRLVKWDRTPEAGMVRKVYQEGRWPVFLASVRGKGTP